MSQGLSQCRRLVGPICASCASPLSFGEVEFQYLMFERADVQYAIAYGDVPEAVQADSATAARRDAILQKVQGTILSEAAVEMDGHPARQTQIQAADESLLRLQSLQVGQRLYSLMAVGAPYALTIPRISSDFSRPSDSSIPDALRQRYGNRPASPSCFVNRLDHS